MLTRKVKLVIGCILLILFIPGAFYFLEYMNAREQRQNFIEKLAAAVEKKRSSNDVIEIRLKDLTNIDWDRVHIFTPYMAIETIDKDLGYNWQPARRIGLYQRDDVNLLVFTNNGQVVFYVTHERHLGDFKGNFKQGGYSKYEAIFQVVEGAKQDNGLPWLYLKWRGRKP